MTKLVNANVDIAAMQHIFEAIRKAQRDKINVYDMTEQDTIQLIANRKYILSRIIERFASWHDMFDCLPAMIQIGAYEPRYLRIVECDEKGNIMEK